MPSLCTKRPSALVLIMSMSEQIVTSAGWREPIYLGRFERMLQTLHRITRLVTGASARGLFDCADLEEQRRYLATRFPRRSKRWLTRIARGSARP